MPRHSRESVCPIPRHSRESGSPTPRHSRESGNPADSGCLLQFTLAVRGDLSPRINNDGRGVTFVDDRGAAVVNYGGLTVYAADGASVPAWFEAGSVRRILSIVVDDRAARYPLTIEPIAQQAYFKVSNTGASDQFGQSVAVSGDTVVVGANAEDSNAKGVNGNQADNSAANAGAAYIYLIPPDCDDDGLFDPDDNCPLAANAGQEDADSDGAGDACDVCPNTPTSLAADATGRPRRDGNGDCLVDGDDIACFIAELLSP
jgi:hypothetical protein